MSIRDEFAAPRHGEGRSIPELVAEIEELLDFFVSAYRRKGLEIFPTSFHGCPPELICFRTAKLVRVPSQVQNEEHALWENGASRGGGLPGFLKPEIRAVDSLPDAAGRLERFATWLRAEKVRCQEPEGCPEALRGEILRAYWRSYFGFYKTLYDPSFPPRLWEIAEWDSLHRGLEEVAGSLSPPAVDPREPARLRLEGLGAKKRKERHAAEELRVFLETFSDSVLERDPVPDDLTVASLASEELTRRIGSRQAATGVREALETAIVAYTSYRRHRDSHRLAALGGGAPAEGVGTLPKSPLEPTQRIEPMNPACWKTMGVTIAGNRTLYVLEADIETDIGEAPLRDYLLRSMEKTWSGPLDGNADLAVRLHPVVTALPPTGEGAIGLTVEDGWCRATLTPDRCAVISIPPVGLEDWAAHELGHAFGFGHGFFEYAKTDPAFAIYRLYLLERNDIMAGGNSVYPRQRQEIVRELFRLYRDRSVPDFGRTR